MNRGKMVLLDDAMKQGLDLLTEEEIKWLKDLLTLFREKRHFVIIVPDRLFIKKIINVGFKQFVKDATALFGQFELSSSWCIDFSGRDLVTRGDGIPPTSSTDVGCMAELTGSDFPMGCLTCVNRENCGSDIVCISNMTGDVNGANLIVGTQGSPEQYNMCPRVPVITYNSANALVVCKPSSEQLAYKADEKKIKEEAKQVKAEVKRFKQMKRDKV